MTCKIGRIGIEPQADSEIVGGFQLIAFGLNVVAVGGNEILPISDVPGRIVGTKVGPIIVVGGTVSIVVTMKMLNPYVVGFPDACAGWIPLVNRISIAINNVDVGVLSW